MLRSSLLRLCGTGRRRRRGPRLTGSGIPDIVMGNANLVRGLVAGANGSRWRSRDDGPIRPPPASIDDGFTFLDEESFKEDLLSRTRVVVHEDECRPVADAILKDRQPIGVDMEGVQLPRLGMVQVKTADGLVYLFRTGRNPALLTSGGLGAVLEDRRVTKVMHGSSGDCLAVYKEGVKMWGLHDTAVAHKVIRYQAVGEPLIGNAISFNDMCRLYGVRSNPVKDKLHGTLWKRQNAFLDLENLPEDLVYYSAADVEPLLDLYEITSSLIDEDFQPLFRDLCETELVRAIDAEDANAKGRIRVRLQACDVFLSGLGSTAGKADVCELVARQESPKRVLFSETDAAAHVLVPSRSAAVVLYKTLSDSGFPDKFGPDAKAALVADLNPSEIYESAVKYEKHLDKLKGDNYVVDQETSASLVDKLIRAKCPVVLDLHLHPSHVSMDLFASKYPVVKFNVSPDSVSNGGLGELLSCADVPKVIPRIDTANVYAALRACSSAGFRPSGFFDVNTAIRMIDFWEHGLSVYQTTAPSIKDVYKRCGLSTDAKFENLMYVFLHLNELLPAEFLEFLSAKSQIDVDIGAHVRYAEAKEARKQLRTRFEINSLHVECERGRPSDMAAVLARFLKAEGLEYRRIIPAGKYAVVEMAYHADIFAVVKKLQSTNVDGLVLTASNIELKTVAERRPMKRVDEAKLDKVARSFADDLAGLGFFDLLDKSRQSSSASTADKGVGGGDAGPARKKRLLSSLNADEIKTIFSNTSE